MEAYILFVNLVFAGGNFQTNVHVPEKPMNIIDCFELGEYVKFNTKKLYAGQVNVHYNCVRTPLGEGEGESTD